MHMTIEGQGLPRPAPQAAPTPLYRGTLPTTGGYRRIEFSIDRSERMQWLRITVESFEAYNDTPVRIEIAPLRKFAHILRDRYGTRGIDFVLQAKRDGVGPQLLVEMQSDLHYENVLRGREHAANDDGQLELMEVGQ